MPIKYSCVNEGTTILAEHPQGELPKLAELTQKVIATVPGNEYRRKTVEDKDGGVNYHYISNGEGRTVACVTTNDMRMRTVFAFLEAVESVVRSSAGQSGGELRNGKKLLQQKMEFYNNPQNDRITALNDDINQVVDVMMDNMDKVLARGDRIDTLHERSATLSEQAQQFQRRSTQLKRNMCLKNLKLTIMIVLTVVVIIFIIIIFICKPNFSNCKS
ncbi:vesicle-associated membrane protein, putative [Trypanosoma equiperdum]|uniref:Vesicle-associated membrane protein, putative n=4 Tax=Trypanozoon TaxID=39700 RepID=Q57UB0_TRYB2|nr:synaptobrevin, putative [Trypanosoma brucei gambiense DAL972]XP_845026.1 vesicle-associated membrane protein, putative [Trypanosoma brucei brucei TREU927]AAX70809.1 vesicle-associated membrane protein, putative [Trypanosoma brucei]RHW72376.1 vesicle-associated membrane protein [Trypanosoma brucei equiperdum]SCU64836.1 vesicle-associated membrane protein, putative [Trypanosoma equiperdum]AAZ11467.1 vesicle-associated membrane protein, putative [Trypanosoma brucei brucei TREU927]CBH11357.1 s|eukprot:XP_011773644.1 synaptobrevin, putative [Trypanosoma brucei gambiense DAL972]